MRFSMYADCLMKMLLYRFIFTDMDTCHKMYIPNSSGHIRQKEVRGMLVCKLQESKSYEL